MTLQSQKLRDKDRSVLSNRSIQDCWLLDDTLSSAWTSFYRTHLAFFFWKASEIFDINHWKNLLCWNHLCGNSPKIIMVIFSPWGNLNIVTLSIMANAFQRQWSRWENVLHDCFKNLKYIEGILDKLKTSIQPWALFSWISAKLFVHRKYIQLF